VSFSPSRSKHILLVEPDETVRAGLVNAVGSLGIVEGYAAFDSARSRLSGFAYDLLVTNVRLNEYNGLHLVYLVKDIDVATNAIVYSDEEDLPLALDAQRAGAFFELTRRMLIVLPVYVESELPHRDRRDPARFDRRRTARGGRRAWDWHVLQAAGAH